MSSTSSNWSSDLPQGISSSTSTSRSSRKPSHSTSKMQYHANNEHQQERDCRKNPTSLFLRMNYQQWDKAIKHLHDNPAEAKIWLTSTREHDGSLKFRYLPLHLAMIQSPDPPPKKFVEILVHAYPRATQSPDHEGNLPIHIACGNDALFSSKDIITYLACSYPESLEIPNSNGLTPVDLVSESQEQNYYKSAILESLLRIQNETLQRKNKNKNKRSAPMSSSNHHFDTDLDDSYSIARSSSVTKTPSVKSSPYSMSSKRTKSLVSVPGQYNVNSLSKDSSPHVASEDMYNSMKNLSTPMTYRKGVKNNLPPNTITTRDNIEKEIRGERSEMEKQYMDRIQALESELANTTGQIGSMELYSQSFQKRSSDEKENRENLSVMTPLRSKRDDRSVCSGASNGDMVRKIHDLERSMKRLLEENKKLQALNSSLRNTSSSSSNSSSDSDPPLTLSYKEKMHSLTEANANLTRQVHKLQYENQEYKDKNATSDDMCKDTREASMAHLVEELTAEISLLNARKSTASDQKSSIIERLIDKVTVFQLELERQMKQRKDTSLENSMLRKQIQVQKRDLQKMKEENRALSTQVEKLRRQNAKGDKNVKGDIEKIINRSTTKINDLKNTCSAYKSTISEYEDRGKSLREEIMTLMGEIKELKSRNDDFEIKLKQEKTHSEGLSESNSMYKEKITSLENDLSKYKHVSQKADIDRQKSLGEKNSLKAEADQLSQTLEIVMGEFEAYKNSVSDSKNAESVFQKAVEELHDRIDKVDDLKFNDIGGAAHDVNIVDKNVAKLSALRVKVDTLILAREQGVREATILQERIGKLQELNASLRSDVNDITEMSKRNVDSLEQEKVALTEELGSLMTEYQLCNEDLNRSLESNQSNKQQYDLLVNTFKENQSEGEVRLNEMKSVIDTLNEENKNLIEKVSKLEDSSSCMEESMNNLQEKHDELVLNHKSKTEELRHKENQYFSLTKDLQQKEEDIVALNQKLTLRTQEMECMEQKVRMIDSSKATIEAEHQSLNVQFTQAKDDAQALKTKLINADKALEELAKSKLIAENEKNSVLAERDDVLSERNRLLDEKDEQSDKIFHVESALTNLRTRAGKLLQEVRKASDLQQSVTTNSKDEVMIELDNISELDVEVSKLLQGHEQMKSDNQELRDVMSELQSKYEESCTRGDNYKERATAAEESQALLEEKYASLIEKLEDELERNKVQIDEVQEENKLLKTNLQKLKKDHDQTNDKMSDVTKKIKVLQAERDKFEQNSKLLETEKNFFESEVDSLKKRLSIQNENIGMLDSSIEKLTATNISLSNEKSQMSSRISQLESEKEELESKVTSLRGKIKSLEDLSDELDNKLGELVVLHQETSKERGELGCQLEELITLKSELTSENQNLSKSLNEIKSENSLLESEVESLKYRVSSQSENISVLNLQVENLTDDKDKIASNSAKVKIEADQYADLNDTLNEKVKLLESEKSEIEHQVQELTERLAVSDAKIESLTKDKDQLLVCSEEMKDEIKQLAIQRESAVKQNLSLSEENSTYLEKLSISDRSQAVLLEDFNSMRDTTKAEKEHLEEQVNSLKVDLQNLEEQMNMVVKEKEHTCEENLRLKEDVERLELKKNECMNRALEAENNVAALKNTLDMQNDELSHFVRQVNDTAAVPLDGVGPRNYRVNTEDESTSTSVASNGAISSLGVYHGETPSSLFQSSSSPVFTFKPSGSNGNEIWSLKQRISAQDTQILSLNEKILCLNEEKERLEERNSELSEHLASLKLRKTGDEVLDSHDIISELGHSKSYDGTTDTSTDDDINETDSSKFLKKYERRIIDLLNSNIVAEDDESSVLQPLSSLDETSFGSSHVLKQVMNNLFDMIETKFMTINIFKKELISENSLLSKELDMKTKQKKVSDDLSQEYELKLQCMKSENENLVKLMKNTNEKKEVHDELVGENKRLSCEVSLLEFEKSKLENQTVKMGEEQKLLSAYNDTLKESLSIQKAVLSKLGTILSKNISLQKKAALVSKKLLANESRSGKLERITITSPSQNKFDAVILSPTKSSSLSEANHLGFLDNIGTDQAIVLLQEQLDICNSDLDVLIEKLFKAEEEYESLTMSRKKEEELTQQISNINQEKCCLENELEKLKSSLALKSSEQITRIQNLTESNEKLIEEKNHLEKENCDVRVKLESESKELRECIQNLREQNLELKKTTETSQKQVEHLQHSLSTKNDEKKLLEGQQNLHNQEIEKLKNTVEKAQKENRERVKVLQIDLRQEYEDKISNLEQKHVQETVKLTMERDAAMEDVSRLESLKNDSLKTLEFQSGNICELEHKIEELVCKLKNLESSTEKDKSNIILLSDQKTELEAMIECMKEEIEGKENHVSKLSTSLELNEKISSTDVKQPFSTHKIEDMLSCIRSYERIVSVLIEKSLQDDDTVDGEFEMYLNDEEIKLFGDVLAKVHLLILRKKELGAENSMLRKELELHEIQTKDSLDSVSTLQHSNLSNDSGSICVKCDEIMSKWKAEQAELDSKNKEKYELLIGYNTALKKTVSLQKVVIAKTRVIFQKNAILRKRQSSLNIR